MGLFTEAGGSSGQQLPVTASPLAWKSGSVNECVEGPHCAVRCHLSHAQKMAVTLEDPGSLLVEDFFYVRTLVGLSSLITLGNVLRG